MNSEFHLPESSYQILDYKSDNDWIFTDDTPTILSKSELAEIEKIIELAVKENNEQQQKDLEEYNRNNPNRSALKTGYELETEGLKRQYLPVINKEGHKEIWINFLGQEWSSYNLKSEIIMVLDGGNRYFNLKVNLETKTYSGLKINGEA